MSSIGKLKPQDTTDFFADLKGHIRTLSFEAEVRIAKDKTGSDNRDAPTHRVRARGPNGEFIEVGAAWTKDIMRGPNIGEQFLSVTLDDPSFAHPLNFSVFRDGDVGNAVWRRRQTEAA